MHARPRHFAPDRRAAAEAEFNRLFSLGIVKRSRSSWVLLSYMVQASLQVMAY